MGYIKQNRRKICRVIRRNATIRNFTVNKQKEVQKPILHFVDSNRKGSLLNLRAGCWFAGNTFLLENVCALKIKPL
jgi:hypothetical protein